MKVVGVTPILNVSDVRASLAWFESLGWKTGFVWGGEGFDGGQPGFASVRSGKAEIFVCRDGQGARPVWMSWFLPD
ncbi:MAG: hypothetical protein ACRDLK_07170, partial [Gaiellaceae bacterium]